MTIIERYSYAKIKKIMEESLLEYLQELNNNKDLLDKLNGDIYRNNILEKMKNKDNNIAEMYKDKTWTKIIESPMGPIFTLLEPYLEDMLKDAMTYINQDHAEMIDIFKEWEKKIEGFYMAMVYAEELLTEDEYEEAMIKYRKLLKQKAEQDGLSTFQLKRKMPPFENPFDAIEWLEHEMNPNDIEECLENSEESGEPLSCCGDVSNIDLDIDKDKCGCGCK